MNVRVCVRVLNLGAHSRRVSYQLLNSVNHKETEAGCLQRTEGWNEKDRVRQVDQRAGDRDGGSHRHAHTHSNRGGGDRLREVKDSH